MTFTGPGQTNAQTVCHTTSPGDYGACGFQWTINPDTQPTATQNYLVGKTVTTPLWLPAETTIVQTAPVIQTAATTWNTTTGPQTQTCFQDQIWQAGWPDGPDDSDMYGAVGHGQWPGQGSWTPDGQTITVQLWRIQGPITQSSCSPGNPDATLVATNTLIPARNTWDGADTISGSRFTASGGPATYTFVVTWPGDTRTQPHTSTCGEPSETITTTAGQPESPRRVRRLRFL